MVAVAAGIGVLIGAPTVRLRGDYLAIVTLGFGAIASVLVQSDWLKDVLGGPQGLRNIPAAPLFGFGTAGARSTSTTWRWRAASSPSSSRGD